MQTMDSPPAPFNYNSDKLPRQPLILGIKDDIVSHKL